MDIKALLQKQKEFDNLVLKNAGIDEYPLEKVKLALLVELGELANEWMGFKYWKKHKEVNRKKLLDEFADCLHFALSLENHLHQIEEEIMEEMQSDLEATYEEQWNMTSLSHKLLLMYRFALDSEDVLLSVIFLGLCLEISLDEMEMAYLKKHEVNYKRQEQGY